MGATEFGSKITSAIGFAVGVLLLGVVPAAPLVSAAAAVCVGDCDSSDSVDISEILLGVNIALDLSEVTACSSFDSDSTGSVDVAELLQALNNALSGCPMEPTATPTMPILPTVTGTATASETPTVLPTATSTPSVSATATPALPTASATPSESATTTATSTVTPTHTVPTAQSSTQTPTATTPLTPTATSAPTEALAPPRTEEGGSILIFPKIVADAATDTVIQILNLAPFQVAAQCVYTGQAPDTGEAPAGAPVAAARVDSFFTITLQRGLATHWVVSRGRAFDPSSPLCSLTNLDCDGAGFDPGAVPPVVAGFTGALVCVETSISGQPVSGNHLIGRASLNSRTGTDVAKYSAVGLYGLDRNDNNAVLCLGHNQSCANRVEYGGCPLTWVVDHSLDGAVDPLGGAGALHDVRLTVFPCSIDWSEPSDGTVTLELTITNELEQQFMATTTITGWADFSLSALSGALTPAGNAGTFVQTQIRSTAGGGFVPLLKTARAAPGVDPTSATRTLSITTTPGGNDVVVLP